MTATKVTKPSNDRRLNCGIMVAPAMRAVIGCIDASTLPGPGSGRCGVALPRAAPSPSRSIPRLAKDRAFFGKGGRYTCTEPIERPEHIVWPAKRRPERRKAIRPPVIHDGSRHPVLAFIERGSRTEIVDRGWYLRIHHQRIRRQIPER